MRLLIILAALFYPHLTQAADDITSLDLEAGYCTGVLIFLNHHAKEDVPNIPPPPGSGLPDIFGETIRDYERNYKSAITYLRARGFRGSDSVKRRAFRLSQNKGISDAEECRNSEVKADAGLCTIACKNKYNLSENVGSSNFNQLREGYLSCSAKCPEQMRVEELCQKTRACEDIAQKLPM